MPINQKFGFNDRASVVQIIIQEIFEALAPSDQTAIRAAMEAEGFIFNDDFLLRIGPGDERTAENAYNNLISKVISFLAGEIGISSIKYADAFNATTDWVGAGPYTQVHTHGLGSSDLVMDVYDSTNLNVGVDATVTATTITLSVPAAPDRFAGRVVAMG